MQKKLNSHLMFKSEREKKITRMQKQMIEMNQIKLETKQTNNLRLETVEAKRYSI